QTPKRRYARHGLLLTPGSEYAGLEERIHFARVFSSFAGALFYQQRRNLRGFISSMTLDTTFDVSTNRQQISFRKIPKRRTIEHIYDMASNHDSPALSCYC